METVIQLYQSLTGESPEKVNPLTPAGSNRRYFRLQSAQKTLIGVSGTSREENQAFIALSRHFVTKNLPVPQVLAVNDDGMSYLQEDFGDVLLFDLLKTSAETGIYDAKQIALLEKSMKSLAQLQILGDDGLDYSVCYPQPAFNRRMVMWDLNYFKYAFLKLSDVDFQEDKLEDAFESFADVLTGPTPSGFMYRDFQSRNVMVKGDDICLIDFQGGRKGPLAYDLASFLWQAKARFPKWLKEQLIDVYLNELEQFVAVDRLMFRVQLRQFVLFRTLQVLGAYGFRGLIEKKVHFTESIPFAIENLKEILDVSGDNGNYLFQVLKDLVQVERFQQRIPSDHLKIRIFSFSYKKGIPDDISGNGGGFVFDCRAVHNPGKYAEYKQITGMDAPVQEFLEKDGEILSFLNNAYALVEPSVERYLKRGFSDLMISFGCTGGQHRSVYGAEKMAEHLSEKYGVEIELVHREQGVSKVFQQKRKSN